jgi:hypothetical protein
MIAVSMPNFPLSRSEAADLAAYIGSLRKWLRSIAGFSAKCLPRKANQ